MCPTGLVPVQPQVGPQALEAADAIAVDEAQFFDDLLEFCTHAADHLHKRVVVAGLNGCFRRRNFGQLHHVIPLADRITKLSARCFKCQAEASFSLRLTAEEEPELVGGAEAYRPVCRK